ncbi:MAG: hypothetical protein ACKO65_05070 [Betaproteobacteria bacterium]
MKSFDLLLPHQEKKHNGSNPLKKYKSNSITERLFALGAGGIKLAKFCDPRRGSIGHPLSEKGVSNEELSSTKHKAHAARFYAY